MQLQKYCKIHSKITILWHAVGEADSPDLSKQVATFKVTTVVINIYMKLIKRGSKAQISLRAMERKVVLMNPTTHTHTFYKEETLCRSWQAVLNTV